MLLIFQVPIGIQKKQYPFLPGRVIYYSSELLKANLSPPGIRVIKTISEFPIRFKQINIISTGKPAQRAGTVIVGDKNYAGIKPTGLCGKKICRGPAFFCHIGKKKVAAEEKRHRSDGE